MSTTKYVESWLARGDDDLVLVKLILEKGTGSPNLACFHAQQAAEKYLKGYLAHHDKHVRKIHDLPKLLGGCMQIDSSFKELREDAQYLTQFYIESRYPDDFIMFQLEDAEKAYGAATRVKEFVLEKITSQQKSGFGIVGIIIVIAAVAVLGGFFGYQYLKLQNIQEGAKAPAAEPPVAPSAQIQPQTAEFDTSNWKTYRNEVLGFEIKYPWGWEYTLPCGEITFCIEFTHKGSPGTLTITSIRKDADILNHAFPAVFNGYEAFGITTKFQFSEELCCERFIVKGQEVLLDVSIASAEKFYFRKDIRDLSRQIPAGELKQILSTFKFIK